MARGCKTRLAAGTKHQERALVEKLRESFGLREDELPLLDLYRRHATWVEPQGLAAPASRDLDDDWVLATALAGQTDAIVTGDNDLLD
jgi:putative PIN family toxin of toxin-antitoxin system